MTRRPNAHTRSGARPCHTSHAKRRVPRRPAPPGGSGPRQCLHTRPTCSWFPSPLSLDADSSQAHPCECGLRGPGNCSGSGKTTGVTTRLSDGLTVMDPGCLRSVTPGATVTGGSQLTPLAVGDYRHPAIIQAGWVKPPSASARTARPSRTDGRAWPRSVRRCAATCSAIEGGCSVDVHGGNLPQYAGIACRLLLHSRLVRMQPPRTGFRGSR